MAASAELEAFIDETVRLSREKGYHPTEFIRMRAEYGTVPAIERLVVAGDIQSGFRRLASLDLLDWTIEAAVVKFPGDFPRKTLKAAATWRLEQARKETLNADRT